MQLMVNNQKEIKKLEADILRHNSSNASYKNQEEQQKIDELMKRNNSSASQVIYKLKGFNSKLIFDDKSSRADELINRVLTFKNHFIEPNMYKKVVYFQIENQYSL